MGDGINRDPIGEAGGVNLYGFVANGPIGFVDFLGLEFVYQGPYAHVYKELIEFWKKTLPKDSALLGLITGLEKSDRDIRITTLSDKKVLDKDGNIVPMGWPGTERDTWDVGGGHDTTTYIDPATYKDDNMTWTFEEALVDELLHAQDQQDPKKCDRKHGDGFEEELKPMQDEAKRFPFTPKDPKDKIEKVIIRLKKK